MKLFTPAIFLPAVCLLCAIAAMALGSAYTVSATLGIAFLTIGATMGVNPALICGAVICTAMFTILTMCDQYLSLIIPATMSYLPYCFVNILNPLISMGTAAIGGDILYADGSKTGFFGGKVKKGHFVAAAPEEAHEIAKDVSAKAFVFTPEDAVKVMEFAQRMIAEKQMQIRRQKQAEKARLYVLLFFKYAAYEEVIFRYTGTVRPQNIESEAVFNHLYGKHPEGFKCVAHFIRMNARVTTEACTLFAQCAFLCSKGFAAGARRPAHRLFEKENRQNASGRRLKGKNHTQMFGSCSRIV